MKLAIIFTTIFLLSFQLVAYAAYTVGKMVVCDAAGVYNNMPICQSVPSFIEAEEIQ